jgi:hypothetical protein
MNNQGQTIVNIGAVSDDYLTYESTKNKYSVNEKSEKNRGHEADGYAKKYGEHLFCAGNNDKY